MKFVALLSGGKDSCYNVIQCQKYGHELVCLGTVRIIANTTAAMQCIKVMYY